MIRINLLQEKRISPKTAGVVQQLIVGGVVAVLALGVMIFWNLRVSDKIDKVKAENAQVEAKIKELTAIIGDIDQIKKTRDELTKKIQIIEQLNALRTGPVRSMQDLSFAIPYDENEKLKKKMWIESVAEGSAQEFTIRGMSRDTETLAQFITNLNSFDTYCDVSFVDSKIREINKAKFYEFNLKGRFCDEALQRKQDEAKAANAGAPAKP